MSFKNKDGIYVVEERMLLDRYCFDGTAKELKSYIDEIVLKARGLGMFGDGVFIFSTYEEYGYSTTLEVVYRFHRLENDKERTKREKAEEKKKLAATEKRKKEDANRKLRKDAEYAEYLRLKEKFKEINE